MLNLEIPKFFGIQVNNKDVIFSPPPISHCLSNIIPACVTRANSSKSLQSKSKDIRFACARLLIASLKKLGEVLKVADEIIGNLQIHAGKNEYKQQTLTEWAIWKQDLQLGTQLAMPDAQIIIGLFSKIDDCDVEDAVSPQLYHCAILDLLAQYQEKHSNHLRETRFDFGKIIPVDFDTCSSVIQASTLNVLKRVPDFKWHNKTSNGLMKVTSFMSLKTQSKVPEVLRLLDELLEEYFRISNLFKGHENLIGTLTNVIATFSRDVVNSTLSWLDSMLSKHYKSPIFLLDIMKNFEPMEPGNIPPAILYILIDGLKNQDVPQMAVYVVTTISQEMLPATGNLSCLSSYEKLILRSDNDLMVAYFFRYYHQTEFLDVITWKKGTFIMILAKTLLKENLDIGTIFSINPKSFEGHFEELVQSFPNVDPASYISTLLPNTACDFMIPLAILNRLTLAQLVYLYFNSVMNQVHYRILEMLESATVDELSFCLQSILFWQERQVCKDLLLGAIKFLSAIMDRHPPLEIIIFENKQIEHKFFHQEGADLDGM